METFYLILVVVLFFLAISDLIVGVSNDAVNFLNSAVGSKAASFKTIMIVAALGVLAGATFSSGMMEVARKGIFHPQHFYFAEIILLFLAVMVTDVILLDIFNTYGMPTSTTVSIVFELLGAAVAISIIKIYTDTDALALSEYINSAKALAIISGILLSVVVAFSVGALVQYLSRLLFTFDYEKKLKYFGAIWGGLAIAAITYFILIKGSKGASFMTSDLKSLIKDNAAYILAMSFVAWTIVLQLLLWFTKVDILKLIVMIGTFALAMAFAGNDLVNFIGVPLAGYNSYQMYLANGGGSVGDTLLMADLAGKVPTPTLFLLGAGVIMVVTLWTSKKAQSVVKTSLDLGRQDEGYERFSSSLLSRSIVRSFANGANLFDKILPTSFTTAVGQRFDDTVFNKKQRALGEEAPSFDMIRAAVTLFVASILISIGTALKLPLSTTYVTFMVAMGTSLADGAWGRESAVYRVSGVISVVGGWFFTAFSAFSVAFVFAMCFSIFGKFAVLAALLLAGFMVFRTHKLHEQRVEDQLAFEKSMEDGMLTREKSIEMSTNNVGDVLGELGIILEDMIDSLAREDLNKMKRTKVKFKPIYAKTEKFKKQLDQTIDRIDENELESGYTYIYVVDYLSEIVQSASLILDPSLNHLDNNHKPLLPDQIKELTQITAQLKDVFDNTSNVFKQLDDELVEQSETAVESYFKSIKGARKNQIKRIKRQEVGTRNSNLFFGHLGELRNLALFCNRLVQGCKALIIHPEEDDNNE